MKPNQPAIQLLSERETAKRLGLTPQQFIDLTETDPTFPGEIYLTGQFWAYVEQEVDDYIDLQIWRRGQRKAEEARDEQRAALGEIHRLGSSH